MEKQFRIFVRSHLGAGIDAHVELRFHENTKLSPKKARTDHNGSVTFFIGSEEPVLIRINPYFGFWSVVRLRPRDGEEFSLSEISAADMLWWQEIVGVYKGGYSRKGEGIKVGVIDLGFKLDAHIQNLSYVDGESNSASEIAELHGYCVSAIIAGNPAGRSIGIAPHSDLIFADATFRDDLGQPSALGVSGNFLDSDLVVDAVKQLSLRHGVHLINMSLGYKWNPQGSDNVNLKMLKEATYEAYLAGTVCICAAGNDGGMPVSLPAAYEHTVGVGGVGAVGHAPLDSTVGTKFRWALQSQRCGFDARGKQVFHDTHTSSGAGLDVVAPSVGVTISLTNGDIMERHGTSFAAPIVTALLARRLSDDDQIRSISGVERSKYIIAILQAMCVDLGLRKDFQGFGLPFLKELSLQ